MAADFARKMIALALAGWSVAFVGCLEEDRRHRGGDDDDPCEDDSDCGDDEFCNEDGECQKLEASGGTTGPGGPGSSSGVPTGGTSSGDDSSSSSGPDSSTSSSSTGEFPDCDDTGDCLTCSSCAQRGPCAFEVSECGSNPDCVAIVNCFNSCAPSDSTCAQACFDAYPGGQSDVMALLDCVEVSCTNDCG